MKSRKPLMTVILGLFLSWGAIAADSYSVNYDCTIYHKSWPVVERHRFTGSMALSKTMIDGFMLVSARVPLLHADLPHFNGELFLYFYEKSGGGVDSTTYNGVYLQGEDLPTGQPIMAKLEPIPAFENRVKLSYQGGELLGTGSCSITTSWVHTDKPQVAQ